MNEKVDVDSEEGVWELFTNSSLINHIVGVKSIIKPSIGEPLTYGLVLPCCITNNEAEYEAPIIELLITKDAST